MENADSVKRSLLGLWKINKQNNNNDLLSLLAVFTFSEVPLIQSVSPLSRLII